MYTHLSVSDEAGEDNRKYTEKQIEKFNSFEGIDTIEYRHILNSGGILNYAGMDNGNYVRAGIIQYGVCSGKNIEGFKSVFTFKSRILFLKTLEDDKDISYGRTAHLKKGTVTIHGVECFVRGKVCMDMFMAEIPEELKDKVHEGDEVILYGENIAEQAKLMNLSIYELFTGIGKRVDRVYIGNK